MSRRTRERSPRGEKPRIIPSPHLLEWKGDAIALSPGARVAVVCERDDAPKQRFAASFLLGELAAVKATPQEAELTVYLVDWSARGPSTGSGPPPPDKPGPSRAESRGGPLAERAAQVLDEGDRALLDGAATFGQGYVIHMPAGRREAWLIGEGAQGLLYAAATFAQLAEGGLLHAAHVRDYPDFRYRAAARWLLRGEINRWAYDWGDGPQAYVERVQRKLDLCLRHKINMAFIDGFGWTAEKFPGYARMMRRLNAYARERGIKLVFGGLGAKYHPDLIRPQHNISRIWQNRESYPWGAIYPCFGEPKNPTEWSTWGSCRANEPLNELRAAEMEEFVRSVEPGAVYIHHEDIPFSIAQHRWPHRCERCRARWPNDRLRALDGGAGALAYGMNVLLDAIFSVRNADSGYDAARDCTVIVISPGYDTDGTEQGWEDVLELWSNVAVLLRDSENVEVGFREIFPHPASGQQWVDGFRERVAQKGKRARVFLFFLCEDWYAYPLVGTAALSEMWAGSEAIYYFTGGLHQEPLLLLNAEFAWNMKSPGHLLPQGFADSKATYESLMSLRAKPPELFDDDGFFAQVCRRLYGRQAGEAMWRFFNFSLPQPRDERGVLLVPDLPEMIFPFTILWTILRFEEQQWTPASADPKTERPLGDTKISPAQWQERLRRVWATYEEATARGLQLVHEALGASDLRESAREDVAYLERCLQVGLRFARVLHRFHELLASWPEKHGGLTGVEAALGDLSQYLGANSSARRRRASLRFTRLLAGGQGFNTVCPIGGDQESWTIAELKLRNQIMRMRALRP